MKAAPRQRIGIYKAVLDAVAQAGCRVIVAGAVRAATEKKWPGYHPTEHAHRVAFFGLLTEVAAHCTASEERALLIADEVSGSSAVLLRQDVRWLQERERPDLDTSRLIDTVHFIRSHESVLVQAADMVGFIHRRANARRERDSRAEATNRLLAELIEPLVIARRRWPDQPLI